MALDKAIIINLEAGVQTQVMFNPAEYTLAMGNTIAEVGIPGLEKSPVQYVRGKLRTLTMELFFDSYEHKQDVRRETRKITSLLDKDPNTQAPPVLLFSWGSLQFKCVLETVSQKFIMFLRDGTPVRAQLTVGFKEYEQLEVEIEEGLFLGPPIIRNIREGETLDQLADEYLSDPGAWRDIAEVNDIDDPMNVPAGTQLIIPPGKTRTRQ